MKTTAQAVLSLETPKMAMDNTANNLQQNFAGSQSDTDELSLARAELSKLQAERAQDVIVFQKIIECTPGVLWTSEGVGLPKILSKKCREKGDFSFSVVESYGWAGLLDGVSQADGQKVWSELIAAGAPFSLDWELIQSDGTKAWHKIDAQPYRQDSKGVIKWFGFCRNIDSEKKLEMALQTSLKNRSDFVAHISHELRTPLNGILPMVEMMLRGDLSDEAKTHALTLKESGALLLNIINDILDFSKVEAGKIQVTNVEFDLISVVEAVTKILTPAAAAKKLFLISSIASNVPQIVVGDSQKLRQVLLNLCGNAIKFTDNGQVVVRVTNDGTKGGVSDLRFEVTDTGSGIGEDVLPKLFEPFFQGSGQSYRDKAGTGLGLSISKKFVELMGGQIFVDSKVDAGTTFGFTLKLPTLVHCENPGHSQTVVSTIAGLNVLTFEPCTKGRYEIAEAVKGLQISVQSTDNIQVALSRIYASGAIDPRPQILVVDTVRFAGQSTDLLREIELRDSPDHFKLIKIVDAGVGWGEPNDVFRSSAIAMPLERQAILKAVQEPKPPSRKVERLAADKTMQLDQLQCPEPTQRLGLPGQKKFALVADDNEVNRHVAELFLSDLGFQVDLAHDGVEAVQAFKSKHYDIVFLDCQMPRLDGFGAAKIIKELQNRRGIAIPLIAITANAVRGTREECLANEMDDYLSKPIDPRDLERLIETWLGRKPTNRSSKATKPDQQDGGPVTSTSLVTVSKLRQTFNNAQIKSILEVFLQDCQLQLKEMVKLLDKLDYPLLERKIDSFRNSCLTIEAVALASVCDDIGVALQKHDVYKAKKEIGRLEKLCEQLEEEMTSILADRSTITLPGASP